MATLRDTMTIQGSCWLLNLMLPFKIHLALNFCFLKCRWHLRSIFMSSLHSMYSKRTYFCFGSLETSHSIWYKTDIGSVLLCGHKVWVHSSPVPEVRLVTYWSKVQGQPQLRNELKSSLAYKRPYSLKNQSLKRKKILLIWKHTNMIWYMTFAMVPNALCFLDKNSPVRSICHE